MKIGSLFSGTGALDMASEAVLGAAPAWFCEWDDAPTKVLAAHWPGVPNYRDVTAVDWSQVEPVDIITGGSPCQDLSTAGKRAGMTEGTRSNLWVNMREAIATIRPTCVVWENVLGALSAEATSDSDVEPGTGLLGGGGGHLRALGRVLGDLTEIGYDSRWTTIRASDVGAPHHRARVFLLATPADTHHPAGHGERPRTEPGQGSPVNASDSAGFGLEAGEQPVRQSPQVAEHHSRGQSLPHADSIRRDWGRATPLQAGRAHPAVDRRSPVDWGRYGPAVRRWERALGRPAPAPTEAGRNGRPRLNAAFAEWMMGLPEGHVTSVDISRAAQLKALGNGVVPQQAAAALTHLLAMTGTTRLEAAA